VVLARVRHALVEVADPHDVEAATSKPEQQVIRLIDGIEDGITCLQQGLALFTAAQEALDAASRRVHS
jgi:hypothetical protein